MVDVLKGPAFIVNYWEYFKENR